MQCADGAELPLLYPIPGSDRGSQTFDIHYDLKPHALPLSSRILLHPGRRMNQSEPAVSSGDIPAQDGQSPVEVPDIELHAGQTGEDEAAQEELVEKLRREREARAQALTLEIVGDLPFAEVKPPENVLFVCKLNPVTEGQTPPTAI